MAGEGVGEGEEDCPVALFSEVVNLCGPNIAARGPALT